MHERNAGQVGMNDFVHLRVGADFQISGQILLDFDQWTPRGTLGIGNGDIGGDRIEHWIDLSEGIGTMVS